MNMIPLVRATEPGRAQNVNLGPGPRIVVLRAIASVVCRVSFFGKKRQRG